MPDEKKTEPKDPKPAPPSAKTEDEREKDILIGRLTTDNKALREELDAMKALEAERDAAAAAAKSDKAAKAAKVPVAKTNILGDGRREVKPGDRLTANEAASLKEGEHFDLVSVDA